MFQHLCNISCRTCPRYGINLSDGKFYREAERLADWFHAVLNFIGPDDGIQIYNYGVKVNDDASKRQKNYKLGDRRIVIGRLYTDLDQRYASVKVDELLLFNQTVTETEITILSKYRSGSNTLPLQNIQAFISCFKN